MKQKRGKGHIPFPYDFVSASCHVILCRFVSPGSARRAVGFIGSCFNVNARWNIFQAAHSAFAQSNRPFTI